MRRLPFFLLAILLCAQDQVIRMKVQLVNVLATVKNDRGALAGSLTKNDFVILDEGRPQEIRVFERETGVPLTVALLVDSSGSTAKDLKFEIDSASRFIKDILRPQDSICIFSFNHSVEQIGNFSNDASALDHSLRRIYSEGGTSLYDAIFLASEQLHSRQGRRVIVLVTDGDDTTSKVSYQQALHAAQDADAVIGVIVVPILAPVGRNIGGEHALITLSGDTGGRAFQPRAATDLDPVFKSLSEELRSQYVLGFYAQAPAVRGTRGVRHLEVKSVIPGFYRAGAQRILLQEDLP